MKKYDCIIVEGDSYSAKRKNHLVYSDFLSTMTDNNHVLNFAVEGSTNKRIFRSALEQSVIAKKQFDRVLCIIGYSFVHRKEIWYTGNDETALNRCYNGKLITATWLNETDYKKTVSLSDLNDNLVYTHFFDELFMFYNSLENIGCDYYIFSAAENRFPKYDVQFIQSLPNYKACKENSKIVPIENFCIKDFAKVKKLNTGRYGHLDEQGHKIFAKHLIKEINL